MGRSANDHRLSMPARQTVPKSDPFRPNNARQQRHAKSQPFDADDLRRRLYIVLAEQEAQNKRQKIRPDESSQERSRSISLSETRQADTTKSGASERSFAARMAKSKGAPADASSGQNDTPPAKTKTGRSMSRSIQDRLRRRTSEVDPKATESATKATSYQQHMSQEAAAAQFERAAAAYSMCERDLANTLPQSALTHHIQRRSSVQYELDSNGTALEGHPLERVQSKQDLFNGRNPFQTPQWHPTEAGPQPQPQHQLRRHSAPLVMPPRPWRKNSIGTVLEDRAMDEISSEETLVVDPVPEYQHYHSNYYYQQQQQQQQYYQHQHQHHRVCDEKPAKPTRTATTGKIPLLRKADSLWTLKKLGGFKSSATREKQQQQQQQQQQEGETSPNSPSPLKFPRFGFLMKLRR
ncbi:uncharacterized protein F4812DRAFT_455515 [Daldinia caldariorum]|uniref:uncharacterized protein n=1 Tax=Daldinia caldariorum TaxID=326644 RepID=UPI0020072BBF|nr:uncharacterized protein F4812DRAFT_455515 [Daldinia caldariorum]KAI1471405.1 hypothetical protein F4812DRAFT_455515 [Daldinia caldariorum]